MKRSGHTIWYAVHVISYFQLKKRVQKTFLAFENVYLVRARDFTEARSKGEQLGRAEAAIDDQTTINGIPAKQVFGAVRKIVTCAAHPSGPNGPEVVKMHDGVEATYSRFIVKGRDRLRHLLRGKMVPVVYEE